MEIEDLNNMMNKLDVVYLVNDAPDKYRRHFLSKEYL